MDKSKDFTHNSLKLKFAIPNRLNVYRVDTFATKEPETLEWIENIPKGAVLWDIGANVGLYTVYAAKLNDCIVYAFEPSVFNLELLARNIFLNGLQKSVTIIPIALSDKKSENIFQMSSTDWGGALSTFGAGIDQNGKPMDGIFEYKTLGMSMADAIRDFNIHIPTYIKMDVDGIEHFILRGGADVLNTVESVLLEINESFEEQSNESTKILSEAGLSLYKKCAVDSNNQFNQWWVRSKASN
jgi:FkbM family methyltransferase